MDILELWGKTDRQATGGSVTTHPLLWHLLDVAAVAEELWDHYVPARFRTDLTTTLGLLDPGMGRAWFAVLAAMHDLGKASWSFQSQAPAACTPAVAALAVRENRDTTHEAIGLGALSCLLQDAGVPEATARTWAAAANVEHGQLIIDRREHESLEAAFGPPLPGWETHQVWHQARKQLFTTIRDLLGATTGLTDTKAPTAALTLQVAGFIKAADWVGSNPANFPYTAATMSPVQYLAGCARPHAAQAVQDTYLYGWVPAGPKDFGELFNFPGVSDPSPTPVQATVGTMAQDAVLETMILIEEEMGAGKTEAALWAAHEFARKGADGLYVALPTMATAKAMHTRVGAWMARAGMGGYTPILNVSDWEDLEPDTGAADVGFIRATEASSWFRGPRRALLSKIGVGTIDQVLMAAQPVKYGQARIAGLAGRVVVFDEVHAYDTFTSTLLTDALRWLAHLGCPVIILSATLPQETKRRLVAAYRSGLLGRTVHPEDLPGFPTAYPCVSRVDAATDPVDVHPIRAKGIVKTVALIATHQGSRYGPEALTRTVSSRVTEHTGCAAIICNSVTTAQDTYQLLREIYPVADVTLLHSRFTRADRAAIEARVLATYGKGPGQGRRREQLHLLVGTQVIEQSLDIDFDLIVTEAAPMDLLLQRCGRLHRHTNPRPAWGQDPTMVVSWPRHGPGKRPDFKDTSYVYETQAPATMLRTWDVLRRRTTLTLPIDIPTLVQDVYGPGPGGLVGEEADWWEAATVAQEQLREQDAAKATNLALGKPWGSGLRAYRTGGELLDSATETPHTRNGPESITIALADTTRPAVEYRNVQHWRRQQLSLSTATATWRALRDQLDDSPWDRGPLRGVQILTVNGPGPGTYRQDLGLTMTTC
ncbi:CRISPR-associated helicase Cas3' [uncultured Kocuria sp.]|uniref:CRISPR-associated helicase Cas3' n=1 Tax=uncultured Kocuria sp. TaxID=259305 RepID=UPI00261462AF|nr:CRISPR-associated helicase Cas3' [uncultured Kocuria sp.]